MEVTQAAVKTQAPGTARLHLRDSSTSYRSILDARVTASPHPWGKFEEWAGNSLLSSNSTAVPSSGPASSQMWCVPNQSRPILVNWTRERIPRQECGHGDLTWPNNNFNFLNAANMTLYVKYLIFKMLIISSMLFLKYTVLAKENVSVSYLWPMDNQFEICVLVQILTCNIQMHLF